MNYQVSFCLKTEETQLNQQPHFIPKWVQQVSKGVCVSMAFACMTRIACQWMYMDKWLSAISCLSYIRIVMWCVTSNVIGYLYEWRYNRLVFESSNLKSESESQLVYMVTWVRVPVNVHGDLSPSPSQCTWWLESESQLVYMVTWVRVPVSVHGRHATLPRFRGFPHLKKKSALQKKSAVNPQFYRFFKNLSLVRWNAPRAAGELCAKPKLLYSLEISLRWCLSLVPWFPTRDTTGLCTCVCLVCYDRVLLQELHASHVWVPYYINVTVRSVYERPSKWHLKETIS